MSRISQVLRVLKLREMNKPVISQSVHDLNQFFKNGEGIHALHSTNQNGEKTKIKNNMRQRNLLLQEDELKETSRDRAGT